MCWSMWHCSWAADSPANLLTRHLFSAISIARITAALWWHLRVLALGWNWHTWPAVLQGTLQTSLEPLGLMMESLSEAGFHLEILASSGLWLEKKEQNSNCSPDLILSRCHRNDYHDAQLSATIKARASYKSVEG